MGGLQQKYYILCAFICSVFMGEISYGIPVEVGSNFTYTRQVYGENREKKSTSKGYGGSIAFYLFPITGLEFYYSQKEETHVDQADIIISNDVTLLNVQTKVYTYVYGAGIRQALAPINSFFVPLVSLGYAKEFKRGGSNYNFLVANNHIDIYVRSRKTRRDSVYATFTLKIQLANTFRINGSVHTVFKAFETNKIRDNLTYRAGFSWIF